MAGLPTSLTPDPKPEKRIVDGTAEPLDTRPIDGNYCPLCREFTTTWQRAHVVGRGAGGDDVPENLAWLCGACHHDLHNNLRGTMTLVRFVRYCRYFVPELARYADGKKWPGWVEDRYL
jgi:5-methylcytosine-specific restriction endonuclease McrA